LEKAKDGSIIGEVKMRAGIIGFIIFAVTACVTAFGNVIIIPVDYGTIQAGIDASQDGDTIVVQTGVYHENIVIQGHSILLASEFLATLDSSDIENTIIDGDSLETVIRILNWNYPGSIIYGFTITGGASDYCGGGIYIENSSKISVNIIENNASSRGGGIHSTGNVIIADNVIRNNHATVAGGGIITYGGTFIIERNLISDNVSDTYGGGIHIEDSQLAVLQDNVITGNHSHSHGGAIVFYTEDMGGQLTGNLIYDNSTDNGYSVEFCPGQYDISNNTICNNTGIGRSVAFREFCSGLFTNNIVWDYTVEQIFIDSTSSVTISYCDIKNGFSGIGNIDAYPMFVDTATGDFNLLTGSPCIDAGDPGSPLDPDGTIADIGAFYYHQMVGIEEGDSHLPVSYSLLPNYPNPFNASTSIKYDLPKSCDISIEIYDILGRKIEILNQGIQRAGRHSVSWNAGGLSSGMYFYRIQAGEYTETRKMLLLK